MVAISGLNGHAFGSFKDRGGSFMWLRDALPKDLPSARILIYGYDTKLLESESTQNMIDIGRKLERQLRLIRVSANISFSTCSVQTDQFLETERRPPYHLHRT